MVNCGINICSDGSLLFSFQEASYNPHPSADTQNTGKSTQIHQPADTPTTALTVIQILTHTHPLTQPPSFILNPTLALILTLTLTHQTVHAL